MWFWIDETTEVNTDISESESESVVDSEATTELDDNDLDTDNIENVYVPDIEAFYGKHDVSYQHSEGADTILTQQFTNLWYNFTFKIKINKRKSPFTYSCLIYLFYQHIDFRKDNIFSSRKMYFFLVSKRLLFSRIKKRHFILASKKILFSHARKK